jgi:hypothetical protein
MSSQQQLLLRVGDTIYVQGFPKGKNELSSNCQPLLVTDIVGDTVYTDFYTTVEIDDIWRDFSIITPKEADYFIKIKYKNIGWTDKQALGDILTPLEKDQALVDILSNPETANDRMEKEGYSLDIVDKRGHEAPTRDMMDSARYLL